jgi:hypothetical protein
MVVAHLGRMGHITNMRNVNSAEIRNAKSVLAELLKLGLSFSDITIALALVAGDEAVALRDAARTLNSARVSSNIAANMGTEADVLSVINQRLVTAADSIEAVARDSRFVSHFQRGFSVFDVDSTVIKTLLYDFGTQTLRVVFHKPGNFATNTWQYDAVNRDEFENLRDAASVGGYYQRNIKGHYNSAPVVSGVARPDLLPAGYRG